jgi:hypothetical protein
MVDREVGQFRHAPNIPQHPPRNSPQLVLNGNDGFDPSEEDLFAIVISVVEASEVSEVGGITSVRITSEFEGDSKCAKAS